MEARRGELAALITQAAPTDASIDRTDFERRLSMLVKSLDSQERGNLRVAIRAIVDRVTVSKTGDSLHVTVSVLGVDNTRASTQFYRCATVRAW